MWKTKITATLTGILALAAAGTQSAAGKEAREPSAPPAVFGTVGDNKPLSVRGKHGRKYGNDYGHKFEHFALPDAELPKVIQGHPRLLPQAV